MIRPRTGPLADRSILWSMIAFAVGIGGFFLWAALAPLEEGVTASGQVVVQNDRKVIQHLEGGIVGTLYVAEGDRVAQGDLLVALRPLQSEAARDELAYDVGALAASEARLKALKAGLDEIDWSSLETLQLKPSVYEDIRVRQQALFVEQRQAHASEIEVLQQRRTTLEGRVTDAASELAAVRSALSSARADLERRSSLLGERLETINNVAQLEREVASLEGDVARLEGQRNEALANIRETDESIAEVRAKFAESISRELVDAQTRYLAARERLRRTEDRLARTLIRAPRSGEVLNLAVTTIGGVVGPGEPIMEIVPSTDQLIALVRLRPNDRDAVAPGQEVEAQITAYNSFTTPRLKGQVLGVSADLVEDPASRTTFYEARVVLDASDVPPSTQILLIPGMPVETFIG